MVEVRTFHPVDYVVFALTLALSAFVGIFHGLKDWCLRRCGRVGGGAATSGLSEQLLGGQDMQVRIRHHLLYSQLCSGDCFCIEGIGMASLLSQTTLQGRT